MNRAADNFERYEAATNLNVPPELYVQQVRQEHATAGRQAGRQHLQQGGQRPPHSIREHRPTGTSAVCVSLHLTLPCAALPCLPASCWPAPHAVSRPHQLLRCAVSCCAVLLHCAVGVCCVLLQPIPSVPGPVDPEQEAQLDGELAELRQQVQQVRAEGCGSERAGWCHSGLWG